MTTSDCSNASGMLPDNSSERTCHESRVLLRGCTAGMQELKQLSTAPVCVRACVLACTRVRARVCACVRAHYQGVSAHRHRGTCAICVISAAHVRIQRRTIMQENNVQQWTVLRDNCNKVLQCLRDSCDEKRRREELRTVAEQAFERLPEASNEHRILVVQMCTKWDRISALFHAAFTTTRQPSSPSDRQGKKTCGGIRWGLAAVHVSLLRSTEGRRNTSAKNSKKEGLR